MAEEWGREERGGRRNYREDGSYRSVNFVGKRMEESHKGLIEQRAFIFFFPPDENSLREAERSIRRARLVASHRLLARSLARETERERERELKKRK